MSNPTHNQMNPASYNPAILQAMQAAAQAQQTLNSNQNTQQGFQSYHQAFQRLQSQEAGKLEQQRLGMGMPGQAHQQGMGGNSQQQFLQMMQQAQAQGQIGLGQVQGMNVHSAQQGLAVPGMTDTEAERRQLLHNAMQAQFPNQQPTPQQLQQLQAHYQQFPQQHQQYQVQQQTIPPQSLLPNQMAQPQMAQPQMPQPQIPQPQILQSQIAQQQIPLPQSQPQAKSRDVILQDLHKRYPEQMANLSRKHAGNQQGLLAELTVLFKSGQLNNAFVQSQPQQGQPTQQLQQPQSQPNLQQYTQQQYQQSQPQQVQHQQQFQQKPQPQQAPHIVGINGPPSYPQQQQMGMRQPSQGHQRVPSNMSDMGQQAPVPNFDSKQFEALQAMKDRQSRAGLITPQMGTVPLVSPQPQNPILAVQNPRPIPQLTQQQLALFQQQYQQQQPQPPQRTNSAGPSNAGLHGLDEVNLTKSVNGVIARMREPSSTAEVSKYQLMLLVAEFKRRGLTPPMQALNAISSVSGHGKDPKFVTQILGLDAEQLAGYARRQLETLNKAQQRPPPVGTQNNPIEIATPLQSIAQLPPSSFQTPQQPAKTIPDQRPIPQPPPRPWDGMDFSKEPFPLGETQFWEYLIGLASKRGELFVPPTVESRNIDLHKLFSLVHKNGGFAKIFNDLATWSLLAGMIELAPTPPPGQPPRSTPQVAYAVRTAYMQFLYPIEELYYKKLFENRIKSGTVGQPQQQIPLPVQPQSTAAGGMSAQFLNAVAIAPNGQLNEQQKRVLEEARRQSQSQNPTNASQNPASTSQAPTNAQTAVALSVQLRMNPGMIIPWIRSREESMKAKFSTQNKDLTEEQKHRFILELKAVIPIAKEAQEKIARFVAMMLDRAPDDLIHVQQLVSVYMFVFTLAQNVDSRQFTSTLIEFTKIRDLLITHLTKLNAQYEHLVSQPGGAAHMAKLMAAIEQPAPPLATGSKPMGPPEDHTAKLPRGLRVEDLKPPPSKRQKVKTAGSMAAPSPAGSNPAATPRSEQGQTPIAVADSPATMRKNAASKRKRETSTSVSVNGKTPREIVAELKATAGYPTPVVITQPPASTNALGIDLNRTERIREEGFFAAHRALRGIGGVDLNAEGGHPSVWSALSNAMEQFRNVAGPSTSTAPAAPAMGDDEIFAQFMDVSQMEGDETWVEPTPELWRVSSRDSEPSPESIRTVGSTGAMAFGVEKIEDEKEKGVGRVILGASPEGSAYNGLILGEWDDGLDFGSRV